MSAHDSAIGRAPHIARSFTVPCTASLPMSPPGKNRGLHDERVGRERDPGARDVEDRAVVEERERGIVEGGKEQPLDQAARHPPASAVRHQHGRRSRTGGDRAGERGEDLPRGLVAHDRRPYWK